MSKKNNDTETPASSVAADAATGAHGPAEIPDSPATPLAAAAQTADAAAVFTRDCLRQAARGLWLYTHDGDWPPACGPGWWDDARRAYGMRSGDVVILAAREDVRLIVVKD